MSPPKGWDMYGSELTRQSKPPMLGLVDLRPMCEPVLPAIHPAGLHFYIDDEYNICTQAYVCKSYKVHADLSYVDELLHKTPGLHYLMYVQRLGGPPVWLVRFATIDPGTIAYERPFSKPAPPADILTTGLKSNPLLRYAQPKMKPDVSASRYPHRCPNCGGPAYVGFTDVECQQRCR